MRSHHSIQKRAKGLCGWRWSRCCTARLRHKAFKPKQPLRSVTYPGSAEVGHAWAYLPDLALTIVRLAKLQSTLPTFDTFHFAGHWTPRGAEMAESIRRVSGNPGLPIKAMPWWLINLGAPWVTLLHEIVEMRYLWQVPCPAAPGQTPRAPGGPCRMIKDQPDLRYAVPAWQSWCRCWSGDLPRTAPCVDLSWRLGWAR